MKLAKALKLKNKLAGEVEQLKSLLKKQNVRSKKQEFDYDNRELLEKLRGKVGELVAVKTAIAQANAKIYDRIFRAAELKGLVATLNSLDTRSGVHLEGGEYVERPIEIEYVAAAPDIDSFAASAPTVQPMSGGSLVAISDENGYFTFGVPKAGWWGFAALGSGPATEHDGKELSQDAVLWINAYDME